MISPTPAIRLRPFAHSKRFVSIVLARPWDIALLQLNEGGKMVKHRGDTQSELRIMANAPLQQYHRKYVAKVDLSDLKAKDIPSSISSADRNLRSLFNASHVKFKEGASWAQTQGKLLSMFNAGSLVPQDLMTQLTVRLTQPGLSLFTTMITASSCSPIMTLALKSVTTLTTR
ncbi:hypothetical protein [Motilimonas pumila]|uniref:hypothetical protein n=1 Tax=Motilimonas pumila TaxID=2303987 RepID=UPI0018E08354|nr:hypothetical protein [Motilimonas pumila]